MPLAANTAVTAILSESCSHVTYSLTYHQQTGALDESDALKVNTALLTSRTLILNTATALLFNAFVPGELVTGFTTGATGYVRSWAPGALTIVVNTGTFNNGTEVVNGERGASITLTSITTPTYFLEVDGLWHSINGTAKVGLQWANATTHFTFTTLSGNGYMGRNALPSHFIPQATTLTAPNGNLYLSTYGVTAPGGYSMIVQLRKAAGFSQRPIH